MRKLKKIILSWPALLLGTCSLPFLPITGHTYLASYEKSTKLGPYEIDVKIILSKAYENKEQINISGYFYYPAKKLIEDGCLLEIDVKIEGLTPQKYPNHVVGTEHERNFPKENKFDDTSNDVNKSISELESKNRLTLTLYDEPKVEQIYSLNLKPISELNREFCEAKMEIKHKVKRRRASLFDAAMSI